MNTDTKHLRTTFNTSAEWYDRIRPGYPEALVVEVMILSDGSHRFIMRAEGLEEVWDRE